MRGRASTALILALLLPPAVTTEEAAASERWAGVARVVTVADAHGALDELEAVLRAAGLLSREGSWSGRRDHLVLLGGLVGPGPDSRGVLDLIMRLQEEAASAGGRVHVLLGNEEVMALIGDLGRTEAGWLAGFADLEDPADREAAFNRLFAPAPLRAAEREVALAEFDAAYPPGYFGRHSAFSLDGVYGAWLLRQKVILVVNDVAFVHGGLSPCLLQTPPADINRLALEQLSGFLGAQQILLESGVLAPEMSADSRRRVAERLVQQWGSSSSASARILRAVKAAREMLSGSQGLALRPDGPLAYRGTSLGPADQEEPLVSELLGRLGARIVVVGHTPNHTGRVSTRLGGKVVLANTGMFDVNGSVSPSAVVLEGGLLGALYPGEGTVAVPTDLPTFEDGLQLADVGAELVLRSADVREVEDVGSGMTRPRRVTLEADGRLYRAIHKMVQLQLRPRAGLGEDPPAAVRERYQYEVAAYRIDRLLGLGMVPATVERRIDGRDGSLQLWVENAISERARTLEGLRPDSMASHRDQVNAMNLLDILIHNRDRDATNILVTTHDWKLHLIDHSRAFGIELDRPPHLQETRLDLGPAIVERLEALDRRTLAALLGDLLDGAELDALVARRDLILEERRSSQR